VRKRLDLNASNSDGSAAGDSYYIMPRYVKQMPLSSVPVVIFEKVIAMKHRKMEKFWFLKTELQRGGGFQRFTSLISKVFKPNSSSRSPGFHIEIHPKKVAHGSPRFFYCYILDDKKGILCLWNHDLPNEYFWFLRYVLRIGEIATFEDINDLLIYQEERYMR